MKMHSMKGEKTILISDMTDEHLRNTIELLLTRAKTAMNVINSDVRLTNNIDLVGSGISVSNLKKQAEHNIESILSTLPSYIYEASIRGISFTERLQELHGRSVGTQYFEWSTPLLSGSLDQRLDEIPF